MVGADPHDRVVEAAHPLTEHGKVDLGPGDPAAQRDQRPVVRDPSGPGREYRYVLMA